jgi:hypothetical protein
MGFFLKQTLKTQTPTKLEQNHETFPSPTAAAAAAAAPQNTQKRK